MKFEADNRSGAIDKSVETTLRGGWVLEFGALAATGRGLDAMRKRDSFVLRCLLAALSA